MSISHHELADTINELVQPDTGRGILAADESLSTIGKRFASIETENTDANRRDYRLLLTTTPELNQYVSGVILFEETLTNKDSHGNTIPELLTQKGIVPGIKVDKGLVDLPNTEDEKITQGLDGLAERLAVYKEQGARFAKWRNVYTISDTTPSLIAIKSGAEVLARYAAICQKVGIVPIVEPEILMDGHHSIEQCAEVTEAVLHEVYASLFLHQVMLEYTLLKPSMVIAGKDCPQPSSPEEVAEYTIMILRNNVPAAVPSINFLSGGQTAAQATANLNAINAFGSQPWQLSFSYGRALQDPCLKAWKGNSENINIAQQALLKRSKLNALATLNEYNEKME